MKLSEIFFVSAVLITTSLAHAVPSPTPIKVDVQNVDSCGSSQFNFVDLGNLSNTQYPLPAFANSINNKGITVGFATANENHGHAYKHSDQVGIEDLAPYIQESKLIDSFAVDINDNNHIVGGMWLSQFPYQRQFYFDGHSVEYFEDDGDQHEHRTVAINNLDKTVGYRFDNPGVTMFVRQNGTVYYLPRLYENGSHFAYDMSDNDIIVGSVSTPPVYAGRAFRFSLNHNNYELLPDLDNSSGRESIAMAISSNGKIIVGSFRTRPSPSPEGYTSKPVFWKTNPRTGALTVSGIIPPYLINRGVARSVNNGGIMIGGVDDAFYIHKEFIYNSNTRQYYDLISKVINFPSGYTDFTPLKINDNCQIVGYVADTQHGIHSFRLDPVRY